MLRSLRKLPSLKGSVHRTSRAADACGRDSHRHFHRWLQEIFEAEEGQQATPERRIQLRGSAP